MNWLVTLFEEFYSKFLKLVEDRNHVGIVDKYIVMLWGLGDKKYNENFILLKKLKKQRDEIAHGKIINNDILYLNELIDLVHEYLNKII